MSKMITDKIKLFIVDRDAIFRLGLRTAIAQYANFVIVGEGNLSNDTYRQLTQGLILNVLVIGIGQDKTSASGSLEFCRRFRQLYPQLPIFVLTPANLSANKLAKIKKLGVRGYCDRSSSINTVIEGLSTVAYGNLYWHNNTPPPKLWQKALGRISLPGRIELEQTLQRINAQLANRDLSDGERIFLIGRKRELLTARWLSNRLTAEEVVLRETESAQTKSSKQGELILATSTELTPLPVFTDSANRTIFERVVTDIQLGLNNKTTILLEIDILQPEVQKKLCHLIVKRISDTIEQIPLNITIEQNFTNYLKSLWSWSLVQFITQHYGDLTIEEEQELDTLIEENFGEINQNIFNYIYGVPELFTYLLGQPGFTVDNINYQSDDPEVITRIEFLLHNLIINLANSVIQLILNNFYDLEKLKAKLYKPEYKSDREIARFRNQLSWRYRQQIYFTHPQNIFESRHQLYVLDGGNIRSSSIYAPRKTELEQLTGVPWLSTIVIEIRDAIAPIVRKLIALAGSGVVFILTQVIGKGLGLIGQGIIQGIGSTIKDVNNKSDRQ
jgi:DNA-binding NarL/FixJ family response regulator